MLTRIKLCGPAFSSYPFKRGGSEERRTQRWCVLICVTLLFRHTLPSVGKSQESKDEQHNIDVSGSRPLATSLCQTRKDRIEGQAAQCCFGAYQMVYPYPCVTPSQNMKRADESKCGQHNADSWCIKLCIPRLASLHSKHE